MHIAGRTRGECYPTPIAPLAGIAQSLSRGMIVFGPSTPTAGTSGVEQDIDFTDIRYVVGAPFASVVGGQLMISEAGVYFVSCLVGYDAAGSHTVTAGLVFNFAIGLSPATAFAAQASGHITPGMFGETVPERCWARFTPGANGNIPASSSAIFLQRFSGPTT